MYLNDLRASLARRWYLLLAAVVIACAAGFGLASAVGPTYAAEGAVVLVPPVDKENPEANRFLALGDLKQAGDILVRSLASDSTQALVKRSGAVGEYTVEADPTTSAPVLIIHAEAKTTADASRLLTVVIKRAPANMSRLQAAQQIKQKNQIVIEEVNVDQKPRYVVKKQLRAGGAVGVLGLGVLCVLIGIVDAVLLRRKEPQEAAVIESPSARPVRRPQEWADPSRRDRPMPARHDRPVSASRERPAPMRGDKPTPSRSALPR